MTRNSVKHNVRVYQLGRTGLLSGLVIGIILSAVTYSYGRILKQGNSFAARDKTAIVDKTIHWMENADNLQARKAAEGEEILGGIEIGSKGVKAVVIGVSANPEGYAVRKVHDEAKNTTIMQLEGGKFTKAAIEDTANAVGEFYARMRNEHRVAEKSIHIIGSSGLKASNKSELESAVREKVGKDMNFLTVEAEVQLSITGTIPTWVRQNNRVVNNQGMSILVDIGSGNTKGGYKRSVQDYYTFEIPKGTVTFAQEVDKATKVGGGAQDFAKTAQMLSQDLIRNPLQSAVAKNQGIVTRERVYLTGGIVWAMATLLHPEDRSDWVVVTGNDIRKFRQMAISNSTQLLNPDLSAIRNENLRAEVEKELERVRGTFTPKNLVAGSEILSVLADDLNLQNRRVRFARQGIYGWILSYTSLQADSPEQKAAEDEEVLGGIEIGSKGVKAVVIGVSANSDGYAVRKIHDEAKNTTIMQLEGGKFTKAAIEDTANAVGEFYARMRNEHRVAEKSIHIVGSSGLKASNKSELESAVREKVGKDMNFLTVEAEVQLSITGTIPMWVRQNNRVVNNQRMSILVDIGSGNTKGGYKQSRLVKSGDVQDYYTFEIPKATVTFTQEVDKAMSADGGAQDFAKTAQMLSQSLIRNPLKTLIERKPGLVTRERVYLTGGIVWAMATLLRPEDRSDWVEITANDIRRFRQMAISNSTQLLNPDLSAIRNESVRAEAEKELERVRGTFTPKNLVAGSEILSVLADEMNLQNRRVKFARLGIYGWIVSYTLLQAGSPN